ncbi:DUF4381 domain-containing protein [Vibrio sp. 665]|uniref:DUF4381 domain-containing protein n=1 Tax=Vibrio TaxID=662 RepID=UPI0006A77E7D|nr:MULTISPECIES: DUF4381 domain-containing protein [Vibrio]EKZ9011035.1 DUF4381 domain-containing protein [Vibrio alginolyticus]ELA8172978.1 DUF4381 domain-containing protein [Vibrio alginolyticus]MBS9927504.1 DUF4381 domain-containing protein [Vibrio alginolyticus]MDW1520504.1 DUF4381 domain-containing protein [Vibrio sp. Vb5032]MDW2031769.1 DUF4381 domain-containing protein [Vibrio sp. 665]
MSDLPAPPSTYILRELHDVAVPPSVSWYPQTIGWKILAAVVLIALVYVVYRLARQWWHNRYRKEALLAISQIKSSDKDMPKVLFSVLKVVLIHIDSRNAKLFDTAFLRKLDALYPQTEDSQANSLVVFNDELSKRWLQSIVDPSVMLTNEDRVTLIARAKNWVSEHRGDAQKSAAKKSPRLKRKSHQGGQHE